MKSEKNTRLLYAMAGLNIGVILALGMTVMAENTELDAGPRVVPYNGLLELNGAAFNGQADFSFTLTDDGDCNFTEAHDAVSVFAGRFTVNIGQVIGDLPACIFNAEEVFIEVGVREAEDEGEYRQLAGRQKINPVPFAYWAAEGSDFKIDGSAFIGGNANVTGNIVVTGAISDPDGPLTLNDNVLITDAISDPNSDLIINDNLDITGDIQDIDSDVIINDGLIVTGTISDSDSHVQFADTIEILDTHDLRLNNDDDASATADGALVIGPITGENITMDGNEIVARDNGELDDLNIQIAGGRTDLGGDINVAGSTNANGGLSVTGAASVSGATNANGGLAVTGNATFSGDVRVTGKLMRRVFHGTPSDSDADIHINGSNDLFLKDTICFITRVENFNENNDRCDLNIGGSGDAQHWEYNARDANCTVTCFQWK